MIIQGTAEWNEARRGKVTASRISDMLARTKTGWGAGRANYAAQLVAERLTGVVEEGFRSAAMDFGSEYEGEARAAYALRTDNDVIPEGFVIHPTIAMSGASPDGIIGDDGLVEFKVPNTATHIDTLLRGAVPGKYVQQMYWQMACTGRRWCDFVSYDPRLPEAMRLFVWRLGWDGEKIAELEGEVETFLAEVDRTVAELTKRYGGGLKAAA